ncbi:MAG: primosomal protein N', partial [Candidatus Berkelbacteria bacterium]|nr:primosomal protein N' [Candidatus Berkelbacteria bacterium]
RLNTITFIESSQGIFCYTWDMIINIIPETKTFRGDGKFSYLVPEELESQIEIGAVVRIPFGKHKIRGIVGSRQSPQGQLTQEAVSSQKYDLKNIISLEKNVKIPASYLEIIDFVAKYYLCSLGEAAGLFLPTETIRKFEALNSKPETKDPTSLAGSEFRGTGEKIGEKLNQLTSDQKNVFDQLKINLTSKQKKPALIYGVTSSGKTEIYLHLAKETLKLGKSVVMLVPEIILTPQNIARFEAIFPDEICIMHSGLSKSARAECYFDFYSGRRKIIVGPRSALLVPNENIGLIIIDEEQEESYKQEQSPRYDATTLAEKIAEKTGALLVFGSATPRIETFWKAKEKKYDLFILSGRFSSLTMPTAEIVDLKDEIKRNNLSPISEKLQEAIVSTLKNKQQIILFLNRRGAATFVSCRDCGEVINCEKCDVPMIYHIVGGNNLICHHCDQKLPVPVVCPKCKSPRIKYFGAGVEKIETEINRLFPKARIKRIDAKVLRNHTEYEKFYRDFFDHKFDIVIGTQILAKGFDIPNVALVGIISADVGLHLPYFRASEKTFRLLTQVSGRSGRRDEPGRTIIQSYWPKSPAIQFAAKHDFIGFYDAEIKKRLAKNYPPASHIIRVLSENLNQRIARENIEGLATELSKLELDFIGPGPCFFARLHNKFRYQIIIKIKNLPDENISKLYSQFPKLVWDVDALDLL